MLEKAKKIQVRCKVNGKAKIFRAYPMERLLDVLRGAKLTGAKEGCGEGECGACSVFINGEIVNSCLVPVIQTQGAAITTIEGLAKTPQGKKVQNAFLECGGAQCGICTPGMVMACTMLLKRNPKPSLQQVREGLAGNLCRCTGYTRIFESVLRAGKS